MPSVSITSDSILARALSVSTRVAEQVADTADDTACGALLETMLGRYVLNRDGRSIWVLIDGRRSVGQIAEALAAADDIPAERLGAAVRDFCAQLNTFGLAEVADGEGR